MPIIPAEAGKSGVQGYPQLHSQFKSNWSCMRFCHKKNALKSKTIIVVIVIIIIMCMTAGRTCVMAHVWKSEDNVLKSFLPFYVTSGDQPEVRNFYCSLVPY